MKKITNRYKTQREQELCNRYKVMLSRTGYVPQPAVDEFLKLVEEIKKENPNYNINI